MKRLIISLVLMMLAINLFTAAGYANNDIQAVCKITLVSGEIMTGYVVICDAGLQFKYKTHGFGKYVGNRKQVVLFNLEFRSIDFTKGKYISTDGSRVLAHRGEGWPFYIKEVSQHWFNNSVYDLTELEYFENGDLKYSRQIQHQTDYLILDYIPIYTTLPEDLYLNKHPEYIIKVKVNEIDKFELVTNPSSDIINQIEHNEQINIEDMKSQSIDWDENTPRLPYWFHDLVQPHNYRKNRAIGKKLNRWHLDLQ